MEEKFLRFESLIFLVILAFSLLFRISNLNSIEFKTDEAVNLLLAARPVLHHSLLSGGTVSSIGILNPPFFNYILTPITFFTLDPKAFSFLIALINSISIAFFYLIVKKYYGQIIAFTSTVLFSLSPWAIIYSRKIWEQDLLVPFFVILFYSAHKIIKEKKQIFWLPLALFSVLLIQLHQVVILFIVLTFIFMLIEKVKLNLKYILIGAALGVIPLLPYFNYEAKWGYPDFKAIFSSQGKLTSGRSTELFLRPLEITGQGYISFEVGSDLGTLINKFPFMKEVRTIFYFEYILIVAGAFICIKKIRSLRFLSIPTILLPFLYFFLKIEPFMHYYIVVLPILFLFLGVAFKFLLDQKNRLFKFASFILFLLLVTSSIYFDFSFFTLLKEQGRFNGDYGDTLGNSENHLKYTKYNELFLSQFIPLEYSFGYNPFARMIYSDTSPEKIPLLEKQLQTSDDPRIQQELLAFYTKEPINLRTIDTLRKKNAEISKYSTIYKVTLEDYMAKNYKKKYVSDKFGLMFFYPQHWKVKEGNDIEIEGDNLTSIFRQDKAAPAYSSSVRSTISILGEKGEKVECRNNGNLCGVYYSFKSFSVIISPKKIYNREGLTNETKAFEEILNSLRFNN